MDNTIEVGLQERVHKLLARHNVGLPLGIELCPHNIRGFRSINDKSSGCECWVYISTEEIAILFFGNYATDENYAYCLNVSMKHMLGHLWLVLIKNRLQVRILREKLRGNYSSVPKSNPIWPTAELELCNVK
jgi:hypothetical protein